MANGNGHDPIAVYAFQVEIDGVVIAQFKEISGLSSERDVIEFRENKAKAQGEESREVIKKLPGAHKWGDINLKRGTTENNALWDWMKLVEEGKIDQARRNGSIVLYDYQHGEVSRFNFFNGWPSKVSIGSMQSGNNDILLEECTIVHEGVKPA